MARTYTKKQTDEEKILGSKPESCIDKEIDYENSTRRYKVTNLVVENNPVEITGDLIETFIGTNNLDARKSLQEGANEVITVDKYGKELYKIEVIG